MSKKEEKKVMPEEKAPEQTAEETKEAAEETAKETVTEDKAEAAPAEEKKEEKQEELQAQYLRLAADFQNYRKRTEKEKSDIYAFANEKIAVSLLDVVDNFERAMAAAPADDKFAEGMELILKQLQDVLKKNNVEEIKAEGETFDPNFHNAVMTEDAEGKESGSITKVLQKGYTLNGKVIRPSMVAVAQ